MKVSTVSNWEFGISAFGNGQLIHIALFQDKWIVRKLYLLWHQNVIDSLHLITRQVSNDTATKVRDYLIQDSILKLPPQIAIPNFRDNPADGETYYIEIATNKFYKQLSYHNPRHFNDADNRQLWGLWNL